MAYKTPREVFDCTVSNGLAKTTQSGNSFIGMTFLAGAYIAIGAFLAVRVGGALPVEVWGSMGKLLFAVVFPIGLMLVVVCGADLFTGNCMTLAASFCDKKISAFQTIRGGVYSWCGNFVGALFVAYCLAYLSSLVFETVTVNGEASMPWAAYMVQLTNTKCHLGFMEAFWRGVGCNWLVCLAVYAATAAEDITGKIIALWIPTTAFVSLSMEHCIANMFFVPLGIFIGNDQRYVEMSASAGHPALNTSWAEFFSQNLLPVTLGNIAGGAILVAAVYAFIYKGKRA